MSKHTSICRVCFNFCSVDVEIHDGRVGRITGDRDNPIYAGYRCQKGADQRSEYEHPDRLLHSLKRRSDGTFVPIPVDAAIAEIAARLRPLLDEFGPRSLAMYWGSYFGYHTQNACMASAFMNAVGSPMSFNPVTIDQPGKQTAKALHGLWMAPDQGLLSPQAALFVGTNPVVSNQGRVGAPAQLMRDFQRWGTKLIVVDPRRTETARQAALHLQLRPGQDAALLAGMIHVILAEERHDAGFVIQNVTGFEDLRAAVAPFSPSEAARRAGVDGDDLVLAARMFADAQRGYTCAGTGANMNGQGTLVEYLLLSLQSICGFWSRQGDPIPTTVSLLPAAMRTATAQALPAFPATGFGEQTRVRGLGQSVAGMPTAALAEEILIDGPDRVRALLSLGGSPATTLPDQRLVTDALRSLDLLVHTDIRMSPTAALADYVIATKLPFEVPGTSLTADFLSLFATGWGYRESYAQYTPALVEPPVGAEVIEAWELLYGIAKHLGIPLYLTPGYDVMGSGADGIPLDMDTRPTTDDILEIAHTGSRIPLDDIKKHPGGAVFPDPQLVVGPKDDGWAGRLEVGAPDMMADLGAVADAPVGDRSRFLLVCRRARHVMNTPALAYPDHQPRFNPLFMNPGDIADLGATDGTPVEVSSDRGSIEAILAGDDTLRPGTVAMTHAFGDLPDSEDYKLRGANPAMLVDNTRNFDRYTGQPTMSAIPVQIRV